MTLSKKLTAPGVIIALLFAFKPMHCIAAATQAKTQLTQAIASRKAGDFDQAVSLLTELRKDYLNHKRINIELALNYIKLRQFERADRLVLHLQSLELDEREKQVVAKLKKVLSRQMRKSLATHAFTFSSVTSAGIDIVENNFPVYVFDDTEQESEYWESDEILDDTWLESDFIYVDYELVDEFTDREEVTEKSEVSYFSQAIEGNYRYRPVESISWFTHPTQWLIDVDAHVKYKQYDKRDNNNYLSYYLDASVYMLQINRWLLELSALARLDYAENRKLVNKTRFRTAFSIPFQSSKVKFAYDIQQRHYRHSLSAYDATIHVPWLEYTYTYSPSIRFLLGAKLHQLDAHDNFNSYDNKQFYASFYYLPNTDFIAYASFNYYKLHYEIDDPEIVNWANESKRSLALGLRYQFNENMNLGLAGNIGDNRIEKGFGEDSWQRIELSFEYKF